MRNFFVLVFLFFSCVVFSQLKRLGSGIGNGIGSRMSSNRNGFSNISNDSVSNGFVNVKLSGKTKYTDYKIISHSYDTTYIDTTLTLKKEYKFNFTRKDNFELLAFHNQGQTFNQLAYDFSNISKHPNFGYTARQFNHVKVSDVKYYEVPTPTSEIMYKTGQEQGQVLDALFTVNFSKRLNVSLAYKGLRSLGHYRRSLVSSSNFNTTLSYRSLTDKYQLRTHYISEGAESQESGGLTKASLSYFLANDKNFKDRARLDVNLNTAESVFKTSRFYLDHSFKLFSVKDSIKTKRFDNLKIGHELISASNYFEFKQKAKTEAVFGLNNAVNAINDSVKSNLLSNTLYLDFTSKYLLGKIRAKINHKKIYYGYEPLNAKAPNLQYIGINSTAVSVGGQWKAKLGRFSLNTDVVVTPGNAYLAGNSLKAEALYKKDSLYTLKARLSSLTQSPNYNYKLFSSSYQNYNWYSSFKKLDTRNLGFSLLSKWGNAHIDYSNINDYVYFDQNNKPKQTNQLINYLKLKVNKEFTFGKFALNNTLMYQKASNSDVFRVPDFVTRNTLYYSDRWFKGKPMLVQIGATFNYFSKFKLNAYNPLLAEFTLQNSYEIGYPTIDFFFNARVRRTRIFFKLDNLSSHFLKKNYLSAPNYPYRDMSIRFGLVWDWFI